jgi:hypothetical protein
MVRADWPATVCPENGLHGWTEGTVALICGWCGQSILYTDCAAYQVWTRYWVSSLRAGWGLN